MQTSLILAAALGVAGIAGGLVYAKIGRAATPPLPDAAKLSAWDFRLTAIDGAPLPLAKFRGDVVLLVNTASKCGYTAQYDGLQNIHLAYAPRGFTVLAVPSGDFLGQELGTNKDISTFCETKFGIKFPIAEKADVVGAKALPIYRWAAARLGAANTPKWNFHKYLIGRDGQLIAAFGSKIAPEDARITQAIEGALQAAAPKG